MRLASWLALTHDDHGHTIDVPTLPTQCVLGLLDQRPINDGAAERRPRQEAFHRHGSQARRNIQRRIAPYALYHRIRLLLVSRRRLEDVVLVGRTTALHDGAVEEASGLWGADEELYELGASTLPCYGHLGGVAAEGGCVLLDPFEGRDDVA